MKIVIANPPVMDWWGFISAFLFGNAPELETLLYSDSDAFNTAMAEFLTQAPGMWRWWTNAAQWKYGTSSPTDMLKKFPDYTLTDVIGQVRAHVLVIDGEGETWAAGQVLQVYDALNCPKDYMLFTAEDTGLLHCQTGAMAIATERMFNWLDAHI